MYQERGYDNDDDDDDGGNTSWGRDAAGHSDEPTSSDNHAAYHHVPSKQPTGVLKLNEPKKGEGVGGLTMQSPLESLLYLDNIELYL